MTPRERAFSVVNMTLSASPFAQPQPDGFKDTNRPLTNSFPLYFKDQRLGSLGRVEVFKKIPTFWGSGLNSRVLIFAATFRTLHRQSPVGYRDVERQHKGNHLVMINYFSTLKEPCSKVRGIGSYCLKDVSIFDLLTFEPLVDKVSLL